MNLTHDMKQYILDCQEELKQLIRDMCAIPAPSHHEEKRAEFCKKWFEAAGFPDVSIDEALNVVCRLPADAPDTTVFMAHTDTVFPDTEPMPFREDAEKSKAAGMNSHLTKPLEPEKLLHDLAHYMVAFDEARTGWPERGKKI